MAHDGVLEVLASRKEKGELEKDARELYSKHVKAVFQEGMDNAEILQDFPDLEQDDIYEALRYAAEAVRERELPSLIAT